jgi:hypothetical protein
MFRAYIKNRGEKRGDTKQRVKLESLESKAFQGRNNQNQRALPLEFFCN